MRNADQTQKKQTKEVATNDESDAAAAISELDDMPTNTKNATRIVQQKNSSDIQEQKKMENHTSSRTPNQNSGNAPEDGHNKVHKRKNKTSYSLLKKIKKPIFKLKSE